MISRYICLILLVLFVTSCRTGVVIEDMTLAPASIKQVVLNQLPGGMRSESSNGRELNSHYFSPLKDSKFDPQNSLKRAYVKLIILGDRRPYAVEIRVIVEEKVGIKNGRGIYQEVSQDKVYAQRLAKIIRRELNKRIESEKNVVDDFRPF